MLLHQLGEVGRPLVALPGDPGQQPLVVAGLVLQLTGRQHQVDVGVGDHVAGHLVVQGLEADQHPRAGVLEQVGQLTGAAHGVDRDHHPAGLPGGEHAHEELRDVLQVDRQPVSPREPVRKQRAGERVTLLVELGPRHETVEVLHGRPLRVGRQPGPEHLQGVRELGLQLRRLVAVEPQPRTVVVDAHARGYLMTIGLTGEPLPLATLRGAAA